ncbi:arabinose efflux permease family protein [Desulfosporosinus acidiphilus SJ4]|uniref:Arabinose efflux permease family protein n=1 Tax=Desulfosporosinus acidiphilus (strain DSM 22704 / JCM 16185 / SJ4) TaxID=646529 RepID=I4D7B0_DESAJ|nr:MFS transporter [Desulfosporosinus acidiphilus]AFM41684.1 arabinose efflux permease family protein [Desulfosporosinus acidiphilus SJ4]
MSEKNRLWTRDFLFIDMTSFLVFGSFYYLLSTLQYYVLQLGGSVASVGLVMGIFTLVAVAVRPIVGQLLDTRGRRIILMFGLIVILVSFIIYPLVHALWWVVLIRIIHGIGWSVVPVAISTLVADVVPSKRRGEAMGYYSNFMDVAMAIGPFVGVLLFQFGNIKAVFLGAAVTLLPAFAFVWSVRDCYQPLADRPSGPRLSRAALLPGFIMMTASIGYGCVVSFLPTLVMQRGITGQFLGMSDYAFYYIIYALTLLFTRGIWGRLSDKFGRKASIIPGMVFLALGTFLLANTWSFPLLLLVGVVYAAGFGAAQPAILAWTVDRAGHNDRGAAVSTFFIAFDGGLGLGALVMGMVAQYFSYQVTFIAATIITLAGFLLYLYYLYTARSRNVSMSQS